MVEMELRTGWLLQIPARALHILIAAHLTADQQVRWLREQNIRFRDLKAALNRLTVEQLIRLINAYPADISDAIIEAEFKEYRHGRSPTLQLYSLPAALTGFDLAQANQRAGRAVQRANRNLEQAVGPEEVTPRLRQLTLEPFLKLADWPGGLHIGYHCQSRLDYIAPGGQVISTYQLLYGHMWVDLERAFVALHAHPAALEPILVQVLSQALGAPLSLVRVDKGLKRDLKFLQKASCRRIRLVDPTPDRQRFGSITLADDEDLARRSYLGWSYQEWENDFPEMASARYYARFVQDHETSLSIGVRRGSLTLSGGIATSDLRGWARDTGAQIVAAWRARQQQYRQMPPAALDYERLWERPLLEDFPDDLRRLILGLVQALATIKERQDPQFRAWPLPMRTYDLALAGARREAQEGLGQASRVGGPAPWFRVMMRVDCPEVGCLAATECLVCPACGRPLFTLAISDLDEKVLMCANANCRGRWAGAFPLQTQCEEGHLIQLDWDEGIGQRLELFVGRELGFLIQQLLEGEAAVYHYNAARESLWVRDETLVYQPVRPAYEVRRAGEKTTIVSGGAPVIMGSVEVRGDFVGRDKVVMAQHPTCPELGARL